MMNFNWQQFPRQPSYSGIHFWSTICCSIHKTNPSSQRLKWKMKLHRNVRDRPFNLKGGLWFFVSFRILFSDNRRVRIFFFCHAKREFFFQNSTLGYMTKTLNQIFFPSIKIRINIGNQNIFLEKKHTPPSTHTHFKLNGRTLS